MAAAALLACAPTEPAARDRPPVFDLGARARGIGPEGQSLQCSASVSTQSWVLVRTSAGRATWRAQVGAELGLASIGPTGLAAESVADVAGAASYTRIGSDSVEIILESGQSQGVVLTSFAGRESASGRAAGAWSCRPVRYRSFDPLRVDTLPPITGTWRLEATP